MRNEQAQYGRQPTEHELDKWSPIHPDEDAHPALLMAIGYLAWVSAELENTLRYLFYVLMIQDSSFAVADGETADWLVQKCMRILSYDPNREDSDDRLQLSLSLRRAQTLFALRGAIVHATWAEVGGGHYLATRSRRFKESVETVYGMTELRALAEEFTELTREIARLSNSRDL